MDKSLLPSVHHLFSLKLRPSHKVFAFSQPSALLYKPLNLFGYFVSECHVMSRHTQMSIFKYLSPRVVIKSFVPY